MGKRFSRQDGETMLEFQARIGAIQSAERITRDQNVYRHRRFKQQEGALRDTRSADNIDGYDRDDIGLSQDF